MSLVSAIHERKETTKETTTATTTAGRTTGSVKKNSVQSSSRNNSLTSNASIVSKRSSIYQTAGEPLSREALYRARLKYGYYQSPAKQSNLGVSNAKLASDTAAYLANENTKSIPETHTQTRNRSYSMDNNNNNNNNNTNITSPSGHAASRAYSMTITGATVSSPVKAPNPNTNKTYSINSASSALKASYLNITLREQQRQEREQDVANVKKSLNLTKVLQGAQLKAESRIKDRWEPPVHSSSHGIKTNAAEYNNKFKLTKGVMSGIVSQVDLSHVDERKRLEADKAESVKSMGFARNAAHAIKDLEKPSTSIDEDLEAKRKQRDVYLKQLTSSEVLSMARANVDRELKLIADSDYQTRLFSNEEFNKAAVVTAQGNLAKKVPYHNKINMGGGLWLTPEDIQNIAKDLVEPVLGEVDTRAKEQRAMDEDLAKRNLEYKNGINEWNNLQRTKLNNNAKFPPIELARQTKEKEDLQKSLADKFNEMVAKMEKELELKRQEVAEANKHQEEFAKEMEQKIVDEQIRIDNEFDNWKAKCESDLTTTREEQELLLKPYYLDLQNAQAKHEQLLEEKDQIGNKIENLNSQILLHKSKIDQYGKDIEGQENQKEREHAKLDDLDQKKEELETDLNEHIITLANKTKEEAELSSKQARLKQLEVDALVNERKSELNNTEIMLKKEKLDLLESMKNLASARGDDELNEEKVKALVGMTSKEYLEKIKESERQTSQPTMIEIHEEEEEDPEVNFVRPEIEQSVTPQKMKANPEIEVETETKTKTKTPISLTEEIKSLSKSPPSSPIISKPMTVNKQEPVSPVTTPSKKGNLFKKFFIGSSQDHKDKMSSPTQTNNNNDVKELLKMNTTIDENEHIQKIEHLSVDNTKPKPTTTEGEGLQRVELKPTFSGFSQGSIADDQVSSVNEKDVNDTQAVPSDESEEGYFKEVFN
ncbi:Eis1p NDAI_0B01390 [Naumovozyma dairenensis CBS 421]|uniref:Eisosome protein 1 n=1 Tax=Naumovozyma dairenensis (strain ATCC 10597 / BCRC 20456 / CBS 421 / NBRC 0211 / NRRL Y-12639) TaxID=1071378 RepID=G0W5W2_NAUDC|nr:hypothetical protein NDAI_0B01390 [Naumovozyma dairenensis CBS 421]CCD23173.1 hypothetical protein NDAI_0B01390 [Naumovozyma dairenensis CBS 421]